MYRLLPGPGADGEAVRMPRVRRVVIVHLRIIGPVDLREILKAVLDLMTLPGLSHWSVKVIRFP